MIKTEPEIALMQAASDITLAAFAYTWPRLKAGMTTADIDTIIGQATRALGGGYDGGLVLLGEGTAYPHGTRKPQVVERGVNVLFDCGCDVHGYKSDISRSFIWGADPTPEQRKGQEVFLSAPCPLCHTIQGTEANGKTGPDLTHFASRRSIGAGTVPNRRGFLAGWIVDAQHIKPGSNMPPILLEQGELQPLVAYLESLR